MKMIYNIYIIRKKPVFRVARDHRQMESSKLNLRQGARRVSKRVTFTLGRLVSLCGSGNWPTAIKSGNWKRNRAGSEPFAAATKPLSLTSSPILRGSRLRLCARPRRAIPKFLPHRVSLYLSLDETRRWLMNATTSGTSLSLSVQVLRFLSESRSFLMGRDTSNNENVLADDRSLANGPISNQATRYLAIVSNSRDYPRDD